MDKQLALTAITAIIETLAEEDTGLAPEGHVYMAMQHIGLTLDDYHFLVGVMVEAGLVEQVAGPQLSITTKGRETVAMAMAERAAATKPAEQG